MTKVKTLESFVGRVIRHRACALRDTTYAITKAELDPEFEKTCLDVVESRKKRGMNSLTEPENNTQLVSASCNKERRTFINEPPHDKTNKVAMRPTKTRISLGIRPV